MNQLLAVVLLASLTPAQGDLVAAGAKVRRLATGFRFTEGPASDGKGDVYFTDIPNNRIHRWSADGKLSTWREGTGGANGLYFDMKGRLLACQGGSRRLSRFGAKGNETVLVAAYDNRPLNSPNDLWVAPDGGVWFTDPRYGAQDDLQQGGLHVYWLPPDNSALRRVIDDLVKPNGIRGTPDGKTLYVADAGGRNIMRYRIAGPGRLADRTVFIRGSGSDGMTLDERGNLYLTTRGKVVIHDGGGRLVQEIDVPESPANVCFGGKDRQTLFITARTSLYAVRMKVRGAL